MASYKFEGTIVQVKPLQEIPSKKTGKVFVKRDFAVADDPNENYPQILVATLKKGSKDDKTLLVTEKDVGRKCIVKFFVDGRFFVDKNGDNQMMAGNTAWKVDFLDTKYAPEPTDIPALDTTLDDMPF